MIKIALILFPGSNCERETAMAVKRAGMLPMEFLWSEPLDKLKSFDGYILIGGFSYEDRSRAGIIAALDPVMSELKNQISLGKPVLGICNGAQILVEAGIFKAVALTTNKRLKSGQLLGTGFYNAWVNIRLATSAKKTAFTNGLSTNDIIHLPVAHAEGRFILSESDLEELRKEGSIVFQYCDAEAKLSEDFPVNPNGSVAAIAAITNKAGNVMAIMPHPERTTNGDIIFHSLRNYIDFFSQDKFYPESLNHKANFNITKFSTNKDSYTCFSELIIADNEALTVQNTLRALGFPVSVQRFKYWELGCDSEEDFQQIKASELLFCPRKEKEISEADTKSSASITYLVEARDDILGLKAEQSIKRHLKLPIKFIKHRVLWKFSSHEQQISDLMEEILQTQIIGSNYAHNCYLYT